MSMLSVQNDLVKGIHPKILQCSAYKYSTFMSKVQKMRLAIK